jgi:enamine deaminase RidA (YjgF/YER057c/UK114 family)
MSENTDQLREVAKTLDYLIERYGHLYDGLTNGLVGCKVKLALFLDDIEAVDTIQEILDGKEWTTEAIMDVVEVVRGTDREIKDVN